MKHTRMLLLALLMVVLVVMAAVAAVLVSVGPTPDWLLDPDGTLPGIPRRFTLLVSHWSMRLRSRPSQGAEKLTSQINALKINLTQDFGSAITRALGSMMQLAGGADHLSSALQAIAFGVMPVVSPTVQSAEIVS